MRGGHASGGLDAAPAMWMIFRKDPFIIIFDTPADAVSCTLVWNTLGID
jgi:hypothetical protein